MNQAWELSGLLFTNLAPIFVVPLTKREIGVLYDSLWELWGHQYVLTLFCKRKIMALYTQVLFWMVLVLMSIHVITKTT